MSGKWDDPEYVREYFRLYREKNRERVYRIHRKYYAANRDLCIARARAHDERGRPDREAKAAARRVESAKRKRLRNRANVKAWRKQNPEKARENGRNYCQRRRANFRGAGLARGTWAAIKEQYGHRCAYCGVNAKLEQEHIEPLNLGGHHDSTNIVPACGPCNRQKHNYPLLMWVWRQGRPA